MYPIMTLSSFVRELYRSTSLSKVISWDTLYLVFKDRFFNRILTQMRRIRFSCLQSTFCRLKETVTLPQATCFVKRVRLRCALQPLAACDPGPAPSPPAQPSSAKGFECTTQDVAACAFEVTRSAGFRPMKQPLSPTKC